MPDPRIERTRLHVLTVVREVLEERSSTPLNFSTLATRAQVSRRTLYTHWGTIDRVISDAIDFPNIGFSAGSLALEPKDRLRDFLLNARSAIAQPLARVALSLLIAQSATDPTAAETMRSMMQDWVAQFREHLGSVTDDEFYQIVGPLFTAEFMAQTTASDDLVDFIVETASRSLHFDDAEARIA